jgi:hypothetical protein
MKHILSLVALLILVSAVAFAQPGAGSGTSAISTALFVVGDILVVEGNDVDWGTLVAGTSYTVTPDGLITPPNADNEAEVEPLFWTITGGTFSAPVQVTFALPGFFQGQETGARVPFSVTSTSGGWFAEEPAPEVPYEPFDPRIPKTGFLNADGEGFIGLGGVLTLTPGIPSDNEYIGAFIMTAAYTGF